MIGAGWAGLASAVTLADAGHDVTVFEAAPNAGGRARGIEDDALGMIDNGQHILLGAYTYCLNLIDRLHPDRDIETLIDRSPLQLESADGEFCLRAPARAAGLSLLMALWGARGLSLTDKWSATRMMVALRCAGWQTDSHQTVQALLIAHRQPDRLTRAVWAPLCLAALNTSMTDASAQLFLNVLRDSLAGAAPHSDLIIPRVDLSTLWPNLAASLVSMRFRHIVREICVSAHHVDVDAERFDACISAIPPYALARTLQTDTEPEAKARLQRDLLAFSYNAIATLTLKLAHPWCLPSRMLLLDEDHKKGWVGQWVFNRAQYPDQLTVVISAADDYLKRDRTQFVTAIAAQIQTQVSRHSGNPIAMPPVKAHKLIIEKRGTFVAQPNLIRPSAITAWPRLFLAGDYTDTGYPAVLEGAVRSGISAAKALLNVKFSV